MNQLQSSLFDTMKQFSNHAKETSTAPVTIEGTIKEIKDAGTGLYIVEYLGNEIECSATNGASYLVGDNVYILVPNGDFRKTKLILGLIDIKERQNYIKQEDNIIYYPISSNLATNTYIPNPIELSSYGGSQKSIHTLINNTSAERNIFAKLINNFIKQKNTFAFGFSVKTILEKEQQMSGNYGITLKIPYTTKNPGGSAYPDITTYKYYTLDVSNMLGFPYGFNDWSPQTLYFTLDEQYEISTIELPSIEVFCYGFPNTDAQKALDNKDILIKDINFYAVDPISTKDKGDLILSIKATEGLYFTDNLSNEKILTPELKYQGKNINLKITNAKIYWFKEDISIKSDSEFYCAEGGFGWACLNQKINTVQNEDGTTSWDWVTNNYELKVNRSDFYTSSRYKCVVIYNKNKIDKIITLQDLQSTAFLKLSTPMENNTFPKTEGNISIFATVHIDDITDKEKYRNSVVYSWIRYNANGELINEEEIPSSLVEQYNQIIDGNYVTKIRFPTFLVEGSNYIYCSAKFISNENTIREKIIGTEMISIYTAETFDYTLIINNDNIIYKYDTNGSSPMDSAYNGPVSARVDSITPLTYTIRKKNGDELTGEEYSYIHYKWIIPKESLFIISHYDSEDQETGDYIIEGYDDFNHTVSLPYSINKRYNKTKALGKIKLILQIGDTTLSDIVKISFLKEGENGSNGTEYAAEIVGGTNFLGTSMPYGTMGANGYPVQLKFYYCSYRDFNADNSVYAYQWRFDGYNYYPIDDNPSSSTISNCNCKLYTKVYENGELLTWRNDSSTDYTVEWSMLDTQKTNPCFKIHDNYKNTNFTVIQRVSSLPSTTDGVYCNIVRAKITIKKVQGISLGAGKDLYVYYPIDLIISSAVFTDGIMNLEMLNGFPEVMYGSDGYNPQYDEKNKKFLIDLASLRRYNSSFIDLKDYCNIAWTAKNHLTIKGSNYYSSAEVVSDAKYDDGNTKNYVSCSISIDGSKEDELNNKLSILRNECAELIQLIQNEDAQLSQLNIIKDLLNNYYFNWNSSFNTIKDLLNAETRGVNSLQILQKYLNELIGYVQSQKDYNNINLENEEFYIKSQQLLTKVNNAIIIINQLGENYSYSNLISLATDIIIFDKEYYKNNFNLNIVLQLENYIKQINSQINDYQIQYDNINSFSSTSYLDIYQNILTQIDTIINNFDENILKSEYIEVKKNLQYYRNKFKIDSSWAARTKIINDIKVDALSPIFRILYNTVELQYHVTEQISNNKDSYTIQLNNKSNEITILTNLLHLNNGIYIRPIITYFNRYGFNNLNVWDGNKLETHDGYLIAPQVGAGKKENDNSFTGIVIGQENIETNGSTFIKTGLFGYSSGQRSIFMNAENGSAIFGKSNGGQIVIDPTSTKALLYSNNFWRNYNAQTGLPTSYDIRAYDQGGNCNKEGLLIDLSTPQIIFGNGNFAVSSDGKLTAKNAYIEGDIHTGKVGGWYLKADGSIDNKANNDPGISLLASSSTIWLRGDGTGKIYSGSHDKLTNTNQGFYLSNDGMSIHNSFKVTTNNGNAALEVGNLEGPHWTIKGTGSGGHSYIAYGSIDNLYCDYSGQIGSWQINSEYTNNVYIGTNGIRLGDNFAVNSNGQLIVKDAQINGYINSANGKIANFIVSAYDLQAVIDTETPHYTFPCDKYGNLVDHSLPINIGYGNGIASTLEHDGGTGQIDDVVSLWVGADKDNIGLAPFRVLATGEGVFGRWIFRGVSGNDAMLYTADATNTIPEVSNKGIGLCNHASIYKTWDGTKKQIGLWVGATHEHIGDAPILLFHSGEAIMAGMLFENHCIYGDVADAVNHWRITDGGGIYTSTISIDNVCGRDGANPAFRLITDPTTGESHLYVNHIHCPDIQNS